MTPQPVLNPKDASIHEKGVTETRDILFPNQVEELTQIAIDIGGSLAKVVWFSKDATDEFGGRMNFEKFETQNIEQLIDFLRKVIDKIGIPKSRMLIKATGGGAVKYYDRIQAELGVSVDREDEMECLITGLNYLVRQIPNEVFTYDERRVENPLAYEEPPKELFPYLLVNIGSGVSILKVTSFETYERISGTSLGGGTLWGLLSMLTNANSFDEMLELSKDGDNKNVDMLVGDIYGGDYPKIGLKATTIASSFGKVFKASKEERKNFREEDISRSLLYLVSNNIGQIAYLNAQAHGIQRIYFSGFFIRGHPVTMNTLNYAINFWSKGKIKALFLRHEGYLGAFGAFLRFSNRRRLSFSENFSLAQKIGGLQLSAVGALDVTPTNAKFPLLREKATYNPDTVDLSTDSKLQFYWIDLLDSNLKDLVNLVLTWQGETANAASRAAAFETIFRDHLQRLRKEPNAYGRLSIRSLLDLREQCLREMGFNDVFENVKKTENVAAVAQYARFVQEADALPEFERVGHLTDNVLAGNMYDWGAQTVQKLLLDGNLAFRSAKDRVAHPIKFDHLDALREKLVHGPAYKKAVIFVDNSGFDIILGIIPFARYLIQKGTQVILAANSRPSINDVTCFELDGILAEIAALDPVIETAQKKLKLKVIGTGSASPCLDFQHVNEDLTTECLDADFVIIEGMGRAIHTNFNVRFTVDCLKIAVFKNPQVAADLGASMYDGIRIFEQAQVLTP